MAVSLATYHRLVQEDPEGRWEYWQGRPRRKIGMTAEHEHLGSRLARLIIAQSNADDFEVRMQGAKLRASSGHYFIPDVSVLRQSQVLLKLDQRSTDLEIYDEPVPFVAEVWSPSTGEYDVDAKFPEYQWRGDEEIWRVHPHELAVTIWVRQPDGSYAERVVREGAVTLSSVPDITIDLERLFRFMPGRRGGGG